VAIIEHADVRRMLLRQKAIVEGGLALLVRTSLYADVAAHGATPAERTRAQLLVDLLTPIAKSFPAERGFEANALAVQIHGGYGYSSEYLVEAWLRDQKLNSIHEGTTGIQAIDLVGRKVLRDGAGLTVLGRRIGETADAAAAIADLADHARELTAAWTSLGEAIERLRDGDTPTATDNATPFLWAFGHVVVAWLWLDQALAAVAGSGAASLDRDLVDGKLRACRFFFECELPKVPPLAAFVASRSDVAAGAPTRIF
jgi:hypothetical protein